MLTNQVTLFSVFSYFVEAPYRENTNFSFKAHYVCKYFVRDWLLEIEIFNEKRKRHSAFLENVDSSL